MKLKDVVFFGFTREEIQRVSIGNPEEDFSLAFAQSVADALGCDAVTIIAPGGQVALIKYPEGEEA